MQIAHTKGLPGWTLPPRVIWAVEIAVFGTIVYLWRRGISLGPWLLAIGGLVLVRMGLTCASAFGYSLLQTDTSYHSALHEMSQVLPRVCAALFSLIVVHPLRSFLPMALFPGKERSRSRSADFAFPDMPTDGPNDPALWFVRGEEKIPVWLDARHGGGDDAISSATPMEQIDGYLDLPLHDVLAQIPQEFIAEKAARHDRAEPVSLPLAVVVRQLKEARIVIRFDELCDRLPSDVVNLPDMLSMAEEEVPLVLLPLELVVPRLPEGVLELPAPSLPAWAKLECTEKVVFARAHTGASGARTPGGGAGGATQA
jgi:hypothetical protein